MKVKLLSFGIAADIFGSRSIELELPECCTVDNMRKELSTKYPRLQQLNSYAIAVNNTYATGQEVINPNDEIAVLPPVSGG